MPRRARCASCGRVIRADELAVRDLGETGISVYHQRCAPSLRRLGGSSERRRKTAVVAGLMAGGWALGRAMGLGKRR